ncbi:MAG: alpha-glucosidase C-terminal domain-containing protein [Anaerolineae bacterium]|nr:alpha-glucosidase C-terminal domain-containing protein [Anaerolineae bacterium]
MPLKSSEALWWQRGVIYQIYPRSFKDNNNDGIGDLQGVIRKLDYLAELGIEAIWLSPIYPSPMADFGYDVSDYCDINPMFGTLEDFDTLVKEAHQRGLSVIIDFVPNHSSDQHPWFIESRSSRNNPKRNWYFWADSLEDGSPPNNWLSVFGGSAWEWDETTQQYYLHSFLKEQPDLNWRNPEVKQAMLNAVRFWLERDVDGFRIDVAHFIMKDPHLSDNPPNVEMKTDFKPLGDYDSQLHIHDTGHPDIHGVMREFRTLLDSYSALRPRFSVGEIHIFDWAEWAKYYGEKLDELHMPFNFGFIGTAWNPQIFQKVIEGVEAAVPQGAWPNYVLGNHDEHRIASRVGADAARSAMLLLLTLRGTPTIYYGDEIGMHDVDIPPELEQDPWGKNVKGMGLGRDPERTPMQWDASANAGFSAAGVQTWLPIADDYAEINVANQQKDTHSMLALTSRLLALRRATPALHVGSYKTVHQSNEHCLAYIREYEGERWLIALNFSDAAQTLNLPISQSGQIVLSTGLDREESVNLGSLHLRANEGCLIKLG